MTHLYDTFTCGKHRQLFPHSSTLSSLLRIVTVILSVFGFSSCVMRTATYGDTLYSVVLLTSTYLASTSLHGWLDRVFILRINLLQLTGQACQVFLSFCLKSLLLHITGAINNVIISKEVRRYDSIE